MVLLYVNQHFKLFSTECDHKQFTIIKSLAVCAVKQEVNETNVESCRWTFCRAIQCDEVSFRCLKNVMNYTLAVK